MQFYWRKNGPRDYRVYATRFGANSECVSLHTTKREALAAIDRHRQAQHLEEKEFQPIGIDPFAIETETFDREPVEGPIKVRKIRYRKR